MFKTTVIGMLFGMALCGCSNSSGSSGGSKHACAIDYANMTSDGATISFKSDVLPIFGLSCTASECHNVYDPNIKAKLGLGVKGHYDSTVKWTYTWPSSSDFYPDGALLDGGTLLPGDERPLTQAVIDTVYNDLMQDSQTVSTLKRVTPGDPAHSFLLDKLADVQNQKDYASSCQNQDPTRDVEGPCGDKMPQTGAYGLCVTDPDRFTAVAKWVAQGAPNN